MTGRATLDDTRTVHCPYCGEPEELWFEADVEGELTQDCSVCCHPWTIVVSRDRDGFLSLTVSRAQ